jgi:hypothetical protein
MAVERRLRVPHLPERPCRSQPSGQKAVLTAGAAVGSSFGGIDMDGQATQIRAVIFRDGTTWAAQCLEYDIGVQAPDLDTLQFRLSVALDAEMHEGIDRHGAPFAGIEPAPEHYHQMWEEGSGTFQPTNPHPIRDNGETVKVAIKLAA